MNDGERSLFMHFFTDALRAEQVSADKFNNLSLPQTDYGQLRAPVAPWESIDAPEGADKQTLYMYRNAMVAAIFAFRQAQTLAALDVERVFLPPNTIFGDEVGQPLFLAVYDEVAEEVFGIVPPV